MYYRPINNLLQVATHLPRIHKRGTAISICEQDIGNLRTNEMDAPGSGYPKPNQTIVLDPGYGIARHEAPLRKRAPNLSAFAKSSSVSHRTTHPILINAIIRTHRLMTGSQIPMTFNANKHKYEIMLRKFWEA